MENSFFSDEAWSSTGGGKILTYCGEGYLKNDLDPHLVHEFVCKKKAFGAMWIYDFDCGEEGPWYESICDIADYDIEKIKSKSARKCIRRGLNRCELRKIDYLWLAENAYDVYINAASRYTNFTPASRESYRTSMEKHSEETGRKAMGVFVNEQLVAYANLRIVGRRVNIYASYFDPAYSNSYPMYALHYEIARHYLKELRFKEVNSGTRPLIHETNIGEFLFRIGWRKAYSRLGLYFKPSVRATLKVARFSRRPIKALLTSRHYGMLESLLLAQDIAKATKIH